MATADFCSCLSFWKYPRLYQPSSPSPASQASNTNELVSFGSSCISLVVRTGSIATRLYQGSSAVSWSNGSWSSQRVLPRNIYTIIESLLQLFQFCATASPATSFCFANTSATATVAQDSHTFGTCPPERSVSTIAGTNGERKCVFTARAAGRHENGSKSEKAQATAGAQQS